MTDAPGADDRADVPDDRPFGNRPTSGGLLVHNHGDDAHHLAVRAYDDDGAIVAEIGVHLPPDATVARPTALPAGTCTVEADCDGHERSRFADGPGAAVGPASAGQYVLTTCELGPEEGLVVAVGDGTVEVTPRPARR